jgi:hypothetical protein
VSCDVPLPNEQDPPMKPRRVARRVTKPKRPRARKPPAKPEPSRMDLPDSTRWLGRTVVPFYDY